MIREKIRIPLLCFLLVFCYVFGFVYFSLEASAAELGEAADLQEEIKSSSISLKPVEKDLLASQEISLLSLQRYTYRLQYTIGSNWYCDIYLDDGSGEVWKVRLDLKVNGKNYIDDFCSITVRQTSPYTGVDVTFLRDGVYNSRNYSAGETVYFSSMSRYDWTFYFDYDDTPVDPDPPGGGGDSGDINVDLTNVEALLTDIQKDVNDNLYEVRTLLAICAALLVLTVFLCRRSK